MKRGQITIFIILGIVLLISVGIILYLVSEAKKSVFDNEEPIDIASEQSSVKLYVQTCIDTVLDKAISEVMDNAGLTAITRPECKNKHGEHKCLCRK